MAAGNRAQTPRIKAAWNDGQLICQTEDGFMSYRVDWHDMDFWMHQHHRELYTASDGVSTLWLRSIPPSILGDYLEDARQRTYSRVIGFRIGAHDALQMSQPSFSRTYVDRLEH